MAYSFKLFPTNCNNKNISAKLFAQTITFFLLFYPQLILITVVSTSRHPPHIYTRIQRRRIVTVTSSCLQRQEVLGISLFWMTFFPQEMLNKHNLHVHTDTTAQQHIVQHIVFISTIPEQMKPAWPPESCRAEVSGLQECWKLKCLGERMLTHHFFFKSQLQENRGDDVQRYCSVFLERS